MTEEAEELTNTIRAARIYERDFGAHVRDGESRNTREIGVCPLPFPTGDSLKLEPRQPHWFTPLSPDQYIGPGQRTARNGGALKTIDQIVCEFQSKDWAQENPAFVGIGDASEWFKKKLTEARNDGLKIAIELCEKSRVHVFDEHDNLWNGAVDDCQGKIRDSLCELRESTEGLK
jgi:hypothetical protein